LSTAGETPQARRGIGVRAFLWMASAKIGSQVRIWCFSKALVSSTSPAREFGQPVMFGDRCDLPFAARP
jgi:hypothetical protein